MRSFYSLLLALVLCTTMSLAQDAQQVKRSVTSTVDYFATNTGLFAFDVANNRPGFFVPRDSGRSYLFGGGVWFGAKKYVDGQLVPLSFKTYDPSNGTSWARPGDPFISPNIMSEELYYSNDYDQATGFPFNSSLVSKWPLWIGPGTLATMFSAGAYMLDDKSRGVSSNQLPGFVSGVAEQYVTRFHDNDTSLYENSVVPGLPIGLQFQQQSYSWSDGPFENVLVITYDIVNRTGETLYDCAVASVVDADLGNPNNDHTFHYAARPELRSSCFYTDAEGTKRYGTLVFTMLEGPVVDENGFVDESRRAEYRLSGRIGTSRNWNVAIDPNSPAERYLYMTKGEHDPDGEKQWDWRGVFATTLFNMRPSDRVRFAVAYSVIPVARPSANTPELEQMASSLIDAYYGMSSSVRAELGASNSKLIATPNPASTSTAIAFKLDAPSRLTLRMIDNLGRAVARRDLGTFPEGSHRSSIDCSALSAGVYLVVIEGERGERMTTRLVVR